MQVRVWGVRGSLPTPLSSEQLRDKMRALLLEASAEDLASEASVEALLDRSRQSWTFGGNTSCVEVRLADQTLILDAGSGVRGLSADIFADGRLKDHRLNFFFTHFHWDHICGLPFFGPLYVPGVELDFWSWRDDVERLLSIQMNDAHFPVKWEKLPSTRRYHQFDVGAVNRVGDADVRLLEMVHPDGAYGYRIDAEGGSVCYITDTEVSKNPNQLAGSYADFVEGSQVVLVDAMYGFIEYHDHYDFGHSSVFTWIDFFRDSDINELLVFHHDPQSSDVSLHKLLESAERYADLTAPERKWRLGIAREGQAWRLGDAAG